MLARKAEEYKFHLVESKHYLTPNQARNLGASIARNKYLVFVDNDLRVEPGWLEGLVACAEETGAWVVAPLYLEGSLEGRIIHSAGGVARFKLTNGRRVFVEQHQFHGKKVDDVREHLLRSTTEMVEFHCLLVSAKYFEELGPLDEKLMSMAEHLDVSLAARENGKSVYLEPTSMVRYDEPLLDLGDLPYFLLRWSEEWTGRTIGRLREKWNLSPDDPFLADQLEFAREHKKRVLAASGFDRSGHLPASTSFSEAPGDAVAPVTIVRPLPTDRPENWDTCAQTVVQLFNQLFACGYSQGDLSLIGSAYHLAMKLFTGRFRPSGKTFLAHLVGTASILAKLPVDAQLVAAGLLHAAYHAGDFGPSKKLDLEHKRAHVRTMQGERVEELIWAYHELTWTEETIKDLYPRVDRLGRCQRNVLLIKLANVLEEALDSSIAYCGDRKYQLYCSRIERCNQELVGMAEKLGFPALSVQLSYIPRAMHAVPRRLFNQLDADSSFLVAPLSLTQDTP